MKHTQIFSALVLLLLVTGCAQVYHSPNAERIASRHRVIAIVPPKVNLQPVKHIDAETLREQQRTEALNIQQEMYSWVLRRKTQGKFYVAVQDIETTNALLRKAGFTEDNPPTPAEMCRALDVDGVMTSTFSLSKPMSTGAAIAIGVLSGFWGPTNDATASVEIHDARTETLIWHFNHEITGGVGSSYSRLVEQLMRRASRKMPYKR